MNPDGDAPHAAEGLGPLLDLLYDAALDQQRRWSALAPTLAQAFSSGSAVLKAHGDDGGVRIVAATDNLQVAPHEQAWADYWLRNNLWVERSAALGADRVFTSQELMPDSEFARTGFCHEWSGPREVFHMIGVQFDVGASQKVVFGVHRNRAGCPFSETERHRMRALFPHLRRALGLHDRLRAAALARAGSLDALQRIDAGVLVVDADCNLLYANRVAECTLGSARELQLRGRRLRIADARLNSRLAQQVQEAVQTAAGMPQPPGAAFAVPRPGRLPITLLVAPLRADWAPADLHWPAAMVFVRDPEAGSLAALAALRELFGLTRAEAAVAAALAQGKALHQVAAALGVGLGTVRSHLKKVLAKTGTSRQGALVALVARSVAGLAAPE